MLNHFTNNFFILINIPLFLFGLLYLISDFSFWGIALAFGCYIVYDGLGIQVGYHKLISHGTFECPNITRRILSILGLFAGQTSPLGWASIHQSLHHAHADTDEDAHSPKKGFWHAFLYWYLTSKNLSNSSMKTILKRDPKFYMWLHKYYVPIVYAYAMGLFLLGGFYLLAYALALPMLLTFIFTGLVNTVCHGYNCDNVPKWMTKIFKCYRIFDTNDGSYNSKILSILTFGLALHNTHHKKPYLKNLAVNPGEIDLSYKIIRLIEK